MCYTYTPTHKYTDVYAKDTHDVGVICGRHLSPLPGITSCDGMKNRIYSHPFLSHSHIMLWILFGCCFVALVSPPPPHIGHMWRNPFNEMNERLCVCVCPCMYILLNLNLVPACCELCREANVPIPLRRTNNNKNVN